MRRWRRDLQIFLALTRHTSKQRIKCTYKLKDKKSRLNSNDQLESNQKQKQLREGGTQVWEVAVEHHTKPGCKGIGGLGYSTAVVFVFLRWQTFFSLLLHMIPAFRSFSHRWRCSACSWIIITCTQSQLETSSCLSRATRYTLLGSERKGKAHKKKTKVITQHDQRCHGSLFYLIHLYSFLNEVF